MVAANEASKEEHVVDGVKVDLDDNAVQVAILESFTILKMFPTLNAGALNKLTYLVRPFAVCDSCFRCLRRM